MKRVRICGLLLVLVAAATVFSSRALASTAAHPQNGVNTRWKKIRRGGASLGLEFDVERRVWLVQEGLRTLLGSAADPDENIDEISVSPTDASGRYQIFISVGDRRRAFLIDRHTLRCTHLPITDFVEDLAAWSSDSANVILHTSNEDSDQLWVVRLPDIHVLEVRRTKLAAPRKECCGMDDWATREGEIAEPNDDSVRWLDADRFTFRLSTRCSPYEDVATGPCKTSEGNKELAAFQITVNVRTRAVADRKLPSRP